MKQARPLIGFVAAAAPTIAVLLLGSCNHALRPPASSARAPTLSIIPWPAQVVTSGETHVFDGLNVVASPNAALTDLSRSFARELALSPHEGARQPGVVTLTLSNDVQGEESYTLATSAAGVNITARTTAGVFWGTRTLLQIIERKDNRLRVPAVRVADEPRFGFRGMHLDVSRHFFTATEVKVYLDLLATYKMNVFHWHLTDDNGWRLPVAKRPALSKVGAFREDRRHEPFGLQSDLRTPVPPSKPPYGGAYSEAEIRDVVAYAAARHITIIPEVDMPGHAQAALAAYPNLSCVNGAQYVVAPGSLFPFSDPLCPCKPETYAFVGDVLDALVALFPGPFVHIGGDEVNTQSWAAEPTCKSLKKANGLSSDRQLEGHFIKQVAAMVRQRHKTPVVWEEAAELDGPPAQAVVMAWKSAAPAGHAARAGHAAVVVDSTALYFDLPNDEAGPGLAGLEKVYRYDPVPAGLTPAQTRNILGIEAALWTEQIQTFDAVERAVLPRMLAAAEVAWTPRAALSWGQFVPRALHHARGLASGGHAVFVPTPLGLEPHGVFEHEIKVDLRSPAPGFAVHYTTDGSDPTRASRIANAPFAVRESTLIKARTYSSDAPHSQSVVLQSKLEKQAPAVPLAAPLPMPGLHYDLYKGRAVTVAGIAKLQAVGTGTVDFPTIPVVHAKQEAFALVFTGAVAVAATGPHKFCMVSNDGSGLWVAGKQVVDNDGIHGLRKRCGEIMLGQGAHKLELRYFQDGGGTALSVTHGFQGGPDIALPTSAFSH